MTRDDLLAQWRAMSREKKDAAIAETVMGFRIANNAGGPWLGFKDETNWHGELVPCYITDHAAAYAVEERIAEMGLRREYVIILSHVIDPDYSLSLDDMDWLPIHATPEQRACAAWVTAKMREHP